MPFGQDPMGMSQEPMGMDNEMGQPQEQDDMGGNENGFGGNEGPMDGQPAPNGQFDFGERFDPGVEADEDEDPKHFIQQLTGKLSQSLNSYEDKDDEGLYKYVGKMINRQVAKNLDDKGKKEMIRAIKSVETESDDDLDNDLESDEYNDEQMNQEEMSESRNGFSKRQLKKLCEEFGVVDNSKPLRDNVKATMLRKSPFSPKIFKK